MPAFPAAPSPAPGRPAASPRRTAMAAPPPSEPRRSRGLLFWAPLLVLGLALLALFLLWPRFNDEPPGRATSDSESPPAAVAAPPGGAGTTGATADTVRAGLPSPSDSLPAEPPPSGPLDPDPSPADPASPPISEGPNASIPAPLRGPGGVDPARGGATWVLGSGSRAAAERDAARYSRQGYRADALTGTAAGRTVHRVVVGQFATFEDALRFRSSLPPGAPDGAWVLRLD